MKRFLPVVLCAGLLAGGSLPSHGQEKAEDKQDKKDEKKWDVSPPPGPGYDVAIDTDEGTWMSLDVSPDGGEVVFDLLVLFVRDLESGRERPLYADLDRYLQETWAIHGIYPAMGWTLVDVHWHGTFGTDDVVPRRNWVNYASLAFGVTTLHDPSNDTATVFAASEMARAGLADLVVLDRNPLEDIRHSASVRYTMVGGRLYDAATMDEVGNHPRKRGRFFWQE